MKNALTIASALAVATLAGPTLVAASDAAAARAHKLSAAMNTRQVVTPKNRPWKAPAGVARAKGTFTGTFNKKTRKLTWRITYKGIGKAKLVIADVHIGPRGRFGAIIVRLCGPCRSGQKGVKKVRGSFVTAMTSGKSWVTVITNRYPNGVIRGQIRAR